MLQPMPRDPGEGAVVLPLPVRNAFQNHPVLAPAATLEFRPRQAMDTRQMQNPTALDQKSYRT